jgi:hypothetical protein
MSGDSRKLGIAAREFVNRDTYSRATYIFLGENVACSAQGNKRRIRFIRLERSRGASSMELKVLRLNCRSVYREATPKKIYCSVSKASAYLGGGLSHQEIRVLRQRETGCDMANKDLDWYEAAIPAGLIDETGMLNIVFTISKPNSAKRCR